MKWLYEMEAKITQWSGTSSKKMRWSTKKKKKGNAHGQAKEKNETWKKCRVKQQLETELACIHRAMRKKQILGECGDQTKKKKIAREKNAYRLKLRVMWLLQIWNRAWATEWVSSWKRERERERESEVLLCCVECGYNNGVIRIRLDDEIIRKTQSTVLV